MKTDTNLNDDLWDKYKDYLLSNINKRTALDRINYAKKYSDILLDENAQTLLALPNEKRVHVMKSLSSFSKFLGCYDKWTKIIKNYQLKWSHENGIEVFKNIMIDESKNFNTMLDWLKQSLELQTIAKEYKNILLFTTLTGLRPSEALQSIKLIKNQGNENYFNKEKMLLEHFKFPQYFIRRTKKAYVSIVNETIIELAKNSTTLNSYISLISAIKRKNPNYNVNTKYCRKIFATFLRQNGIEQEMIDLLQVRIPKSIFVRHYYRPYLNGFDKIRKFLRNLHQKIT